MLTDYCLALSITQVLCLRGIDLDKVCGQGINEHGRTLFGNALSDGIGQFWTSW